MGKSWEREILFSGKVWKMEEYFVLCVFPIFQTADWGQKIRYPAADDLFRVSLIKKIAGAFPKQRRFRAGGCGDRLPACVVRFPAYARKRHRKEHFIG